MKKPSADKPLEDELTKLLALRFKGIRVRVEHSERWNRPCVTFFWSGFEGLLPEERFHRLVTALPADVREKRLAGFVWLELAEGEDVETFLKQPRSEDVAGREAEIRGRLARSGFFDALSEALGPSPEKKCGGDFRSTASVLSSKRFSARRIVDAKLLMIRHGAFCDCQVLSLKSAMSG